jgi:hypothetical protein
MSEVCRKAAALIIRDGQMLTITATKVPDVYSLPGGPEADGQPRYETLRKELALELGITWPSRTPGPKPA